MKLLDRYLLEELLPPFLVGVLTVLALILGDQLYQVMRLVLSKGVEPGLVLQMLLFKLPEALVLAFPLSAILGVSLAVNRLAREGELAAMRIGGFGLRRILTTILLFGCGVTVVDFTINDRIAPEANYAFRNRQGNLLWQNPALLLRARTFFKPSDEKDTYIYIGAMDDQTQELRDVLIFQNLRSDFPYALIARTATYRDGIWYLRDVIEHRWHTNGVLVREANDQRAELNLKQIMDDRGGWMPNRDAASQTLAELKQQMDLYERNQIPIRRDLRFEYYKRFSVPVGCLVLTLLAAVLGIRASRTGSYAGLLIAVVLAFFYFLSRAWFHQLGHNGLLSPLLAAWAQNFLFGGGGLLLLRRL